MLPWAKANSSVSSHVLRPRGASLSSVAISGPGSGSTTASGNAAVADVPITLTANAVSATEGVAFSGQVGHFTDGNPFAVAGNFAVTIDWGDGSVLDTTTGAVTADVVDGGFNITAGHTFNHAGPGTISVTVNDPIGTSTATQTAVTTVGYGTVNASLAAINATEGASFTGTLATFTDTNTSAAVSDFGATITWPNDATSTGTIATTGTPGTFTVSFPAGHTFNCAVSRGQRRDHGGE